MGFSKARSAECLQELPPRIGHILERLIEIEPIPMDPAGPFLFPPGYLRVGTRWECFYCCFCGGWCHLPCSLNILFWFSRRRFPHSQLATRVVPP